MCPPHVRVSLLALFAVSGLGVSPAAAGVIHESFDYPVGQAFTRSASDPDLGTGWNGGSGWASSSAWGLGRDGTSPRITARIVPGLAMGTMPVAGGALELEHVGSGFGALARAVDESFTSGALWSSYLYRHVAAPDREPYSADVGASPVPFQGGSGRKFRNLADAGASTYFGGVAGAHVPVVSTGPSLYDGSTYLLIAKYANLGATGEAKWWVLTEGDYSDWISGGMSEAALDLHHVGRVTAPGQPGRTLDPGNFIQAAASKGTAAFDEIRYGASLNEAVATAPGISVLYEEQFPNATGEAQPTGTAGWAAFAGPSAVDYTADTSSNQDARAGVSEIDGFPRWNGPGYGFAAADNGPVDFLVFTEELAPLDPVASAPLEFSWRQHASGYNVEFRLALEIDDQWFATDEAFVNTLTGQLGSGSEFPDEATFWSVLFSQDATLWRNLDFMPGSLLSLDSDARTLDLPGGPITAAGLFISAPDDRMARFDAFRVLGVPASAGHVLPEPGTVGLLAAGGLLLLAGWGLRRR